jgi:hypothetical protein
VSPRLRHKNHNRNSKKLSWLALKASSAWDNFSQWWEEQIGFVNETKWVTPLPVSPNVPTFANGITVGASRWRGCKRCLKVDTLRCWSWRRIYCCASAGVVDLSALQRERERERKNVRWKEEKSLSLFFPPARL